MHKATIMLMNENERQLQNITDFLQEQDFKVISVLNSIDFQQEILQSKADLIIIGIDSTIGKGLELFQHLRANKALEDTFVVMMSQKKEDEIHIMALDCGADDFWIQPIAQRVLLKKVDALLKRKKIKSPEGNSAFYIDFERFLIIKDNQEIFLPKKEFQLLSLLYSKPEKIFSREEIKRILWENIDTVQTRTIDVHIRKIREKIGENIIATVQGMGYKLQVA